MDNVSTYVWICYVCSTKVVHCTSYIYIYKKYIMMRIKNRTDINLYPCRCQIVFVCVVIFL